MITAFRKDFVVLVGSPQGWNCINEQFKRIHRKYGIQGTVLAFDVLYLAGYMRTWHRISLTC